MDTTLEAQLAPLRSQIDDIDAELLKLINRRAELAIQVGTIKKENFAAIYQPLREAQVFDRLSSRNTGPIPTSSFQIIWRAIIDACRSVEHSENHFSSEVSLDASLSRHHRVAYLGPVGTYSEQAAIAYFGETLERFPMQNIDEVFMSIDDDQVDFAVVAIENSNEGVVTRVLDLLEKTSASIIGETILPIRHYLLGSTNDIGKIEQVAAHPHALAQCQRWLNTHLPSADRISTASNAVAANQAKASEKIACIAGASAKHSYALQALAANIQDDPSNRTRFFVLSKRTTHITGDDKTSLIVSVEHRAGSIASLTEPLARHRVSMTHFQSRPKKECHWEYLFYIDMLGHCKEPHVASALEEMQKQATYFKILGSYPRASITPSVSSISHLA